MRAAWLEAQTTAAAVAATRDFMFRGSGERESEGKVRESRTGKPATFNLAPFRMFANEKK
jgi:hypothetical protein